MIQQTVPAVSTCSNPQVTTHLVHLGYPPAASKSLGLLAHFWLPKAVRSLEGALSLMLASEVMIQLLVKASTMNRKLDLNEST